MSVFLESCLALCLFAMLTRIPEKCFILGSQDRDAAQDDKSISFSFPKCLGPALIYSLKNKIKQNNGFFLWLT